MVELTICGLVGLAAMLIVAFYFACADDFAPAREKSSFDLVNNAQSGNSRLGRTVVKQQATPAPAPWLQTTSERVPGALCSSQYDCGQLEVFRG